MSRHKTMTEKVKQYLVYREELGYGLSAHKSALLKFASYADSIRHRGPLTISLAVKWARLPVDRSPRSWSHRLTRVRCLALYLAIDEPKTEIPPVNLLGPGHERKTPTIYSEADISALIATAKQLHPPNGLRPQTYATLIGLLACTGMRLSEATNLRKADFNDRQGILTIRETKFHKSRLVPLHPSATKELRAYARKRDQIVTLATTDHFFLNDVGTPLYNATVDHLFRKLCNDSSIAKKGLGRQPRLHDLRHTFACRRVQQWYDTGANVNHVIAALSTYLGHAEVTYTYWYLTATPELLACAVARFTSPHNDKERPQ